MVGAGVVDTARLMYTYDERACRPLSARTIEAAMCVLYLGAAALTERHVSGS